MGEVESLCASIDRYGGLNKVSEIFVDKLRNIEIESQWHLACDFLDVIEELYPDEFEDAYEEYKKRTKQG